MLKVVHSESVVDSYPDGAQAWLSTWFGRMEKGDPRDFQPPLWARSDRGDIVDEWLKRHPSTGFPSLDEFERDARSLTGTSSVLRAWSEREREARLTYENRPDSIDPARLQKAKELVTHWLKPSRTLRPSDLETVVEEAEKSTNWGAPFFASGRDTWREHLKIARNLGEDFGPDAELSSVAGARVQSHGDESRNRLIWITAHAYVLRELAYLRPLLGRHARTPGFSAWGRPDDVDAGATRVINSSGSRPTLSGDFSSFDATVPDSILLAANDITKAHFQVENDTALDSLTLIMTESPLLVPGELWTGPHGIGSGFGKTNWDGTMSHLLIIAYVAVSLDVVVEDYEILGDDGIYSLNPFPDPKEVEGVVKELGMGMNAEKQFVGVGEVHFLQRWHSREYSRNGVYPGVRSAVRTINSTISPERDRGDWSQDMLSVNSIMQLENAKHHMFFDELVGYYVEGDPNLRGKPETLLARAGGEKRVKEELGVGSFPYRFQPLDRYKDFAAVESIRRQFG